MSSAVLPAPESSSKLTKLPRKGVPAAPASKLRTPAKPGTKLPGPKPRSAAAPLTSTLPRRGSGLKAPTKTGVKADTRSRVGSDAKKINETKPKSEAKPKTEAKQNSDSKPVTRTKKPGSDSRPRHKRTTRAQTSAECVASSADHRDKLPVAPPRSGVGIKRSVTTRKISSAAKPTVTQNSTKHNSLERSFSSNSSCSNESVLSMRSDSKRRNDSGVRRDNSGSRRDNSGGARVLKSKQVSGSEGRSQPAKRGLKRPSRVTRPKENELIPDNCKENVALLRKDCTAFGSQPKDLSVLSKSQSKESLMRGATTAKRRSSLPSVIINPTELLLNRSLHDKLSQNQSNRHGFVLTDTDASIASLSSDQLMSADEDGFPASTLHTPVPPDQEGFETDKIISDDDYDLVASDSCLLPDEPKTPKDLDTSFSTTETDISLERVESELNSISNRIAESALNDLSDPNRSPSLNINPDEAYYKDASPLDLSTIRPSPQDLQSLITPTEKTISDRDWNKAFMNASPDDNFQASKSNRLGEEQDLYYDSSDLNLDSSSNESIGKKPEEKKKKSTYEAPVVPTEEKELNIEKKVPAAKEEEEEEEESPNEVAPAIEDIISPLSNDSDPLAVMLNFTPSIILEPPESPSSAPSSAPPSVILPQKFPDHQTFTRSQRSIRPSRKSKQLVRSSSYDKKFLTECSDLHSGSLDSFDSPDIHVVEQLSSASPVFARATPEIRVSGSEQEECVINESLPPEYTPKRRFILRSKQRNDVVRRFSETQVFRHHKEKYMKRKEMEEKYNSCPVSSGSPDKLESPRYIKGLVKRVSSMLHHTGKPSIRLRKDRAFYGSTASVCVSLDSAEARSLHDELGATDNIGDIARLKRCNSVEFDDQISSIRRPLTNHDGEHPDHVLTPKAKSITEQLDRSTFGAPDTAIPPLEFQNWTEIVADTIVEGLPKKTMDQQHHIWELITTEHNHITMLSTVISTLLHALRELHAENVLTKIDEYDVFLNIEKIREIHLTFWDECIVPLIQRAHDTGDLLNPEDLANAGSLFEGEFNPLFEYCIKYIESRSFIKTQQHKNADFKEYITWCDAQTRSKHNKLELDAILIKPIQRIQKYPYMIKDILKKTVDDDTRTILSNFHEKVSVFVESLNRAKEEKEEQQQIENIKERIESYSVLNLNSSQTNEQINQLLKTYNKFDLADRVPLLNTQRKFLHENACKLSPNPDSKAHDVILFLFSDHILITRPNKSSKKKNRIIKQPLTLDRVVIEEMKDSSHTNLLVYLNEYGSLVDMFLLTSQNQEQHTTLLNAVTRAKDNYLREKNKLYTELDASKSLSTNSVNSVYLTSPSSLQQRAPCSITRSSSENYPATRRAAEAPATSVSRAQSMPASNDKRVLHVESNIATSSSASSSASSSSASVSEQSAHSVDSSSKSITLSDIKESDKLHEDSDEITMKCLGNTRISPPTLDTNKNTDIFISNLSTEFKGKLDINKSICDPVNLSTNNEKEYNSSKEDNIFLQQSDS